MIAAIGAGTTTAGGYANAIVALDPKTLELKDWFSQPGVELAAAPVVFEEGGRNLVAVTTRDARLLLLDAASLGGAEPCDAALRVGAADWRTRYVFVAAPGDVAGASAPQRLERRLQQAAHAGC